jgi:ketosteroid isomerase-like protein
MGLKEAISKWMELFNAGDAEQLSELYQEDAVMHQVAYETVRGKESIRRMLLAGFEMTTIEIHSHEPDRKW